MYSNRTIPDSDATHTPCYWMDVLSIYSGKVTSIGRELVGNAGFLLLHRLLCLTPPILDIIIQEQPTHRSPSMICRIPCSSRVGFGVVLRAVTLGCWVERVGEC